MTWKYCFSITFIRQIFSDYKLSCIFFLFNGKDNIKTKNEIKENNLWKKDCILLDLLTIRYFVIFFTGAYENKINDGIKRRQKSARFIATHSLKSNAFLPCYIVEREREREKRGRH